jgi:hypothetical protein
MFEICFLSVSQHDNSLPTAFKGRINQPNKKNKRKLFSEFRNEDNIYLGLNKVLDDIDII